MSAGIRLTKLSVDHYRTVAAVTVLLTLCIALAGGLPGILGKAIGPLVPITVDTDPENMLSADEPVRLFHREMKKQLALHDMVVVGVVNDSHPEGVFNVASLGRVYELTEFARTLRGSTIGAGPGEGVVEKDLIALSTVDSIEPSSAGVSFSWLMPRRSATEAEALEVRRKAMRVPFLNGTVVSEDARAVCLYLPLTRKDLSHSIYVKLRDKIATFGGDDEFYITGLPVAEDTFGVEMFIQMAISAPAAMLVIFVLMLVFFRKLVLILSPLIVAMMSVIFTMGTLVIAGFPVHIMSSMIPIFIMPIAVLDSIHIISEFFEKYQATRDRRKTLLAVMDELFMPMLYTSLTSAAGFASLALTPIPPVQVFGIFVAAGIMFAWLLTVTFIPAFIMFIPAKTLENFGARHDHLAGTAKATALSRFLHAMGSGTYRRAKPIVALTVVIVVLSGWGISRININDNPVKWFAPSHPIRIADRVLNEHFGGTYMAYLALTAPPLTADDAFAAQFGQALNEQATQATTPAAGEVFNKVAAIAATVRGGRDLPRVEFFRRLDTALRTERSGADAPPAAPPETAPDAAAALPGGMDDAPGLPAGLGDEPTQSAPVEETDRTVEDAWDAAMLFVSAQSQSAQVFKDPAVLQRVVDLQELLGDSAVVGKSNSLADIVRTVHRDFVSGQDRDYRLPENANGVAQMLVQYESSHRKDDLWHFVTGDYRTTSIWVQLTSGDNRDMSRVVAAVNQYVEANPLPEGIHHQWFGLTYINVVWQDKMVTGMLEAFTGSFLVVFLLMTLLFRSALWGLLSMLPLTVTIAAIYGVVGFVGKDYDMPVAVLSSLTLGLAVDFAIHFLARARAVYAEAGSWQAAAPAVFGEPARAITRNIIVIAAGFTPLLLAPLVPYKTVGVLMATILLVSGAATLLLLPAVMRLMEKGLFPRSSVVKTTCNCGTCIVVAATAVAVVTMNFFRYIDADWPVLTGVSVAVIVVGVAACWGLSKRAKCKLPAQRAEEKS